jgi:hypothetical protein
MIRATLPLLLGNLGVSHPVVKSLAEQFQIRESLASIPMYNAPTATTNGTLAELVERLDGLSSPISEPQQSHRGADGTYRMQHEVVDILFSHELLMQGSASSPWGG